ncbi:class I SAM-dependent methyltransferase [Streptomyces sp. SP18ES09]|uniref:class I SAM-dependent methyltransferase n=1 Tax=Streptomyces sp. SP18ES09 TaxID=3002532 RepID=UPI002E769CDC|nr:class I SAM-dependent methyltransferase [Streptomyces sp. SP18ES09]MEE1816178.1 class I SAM-dependent methyltransferase [Streptomyces sp. SP18ES09]
MTVVVVRDPAVETPFGVSAALLAAGLALRLEPPLDRVPPTTGLAGVEALVVLSARRSDVAPVLALLRDAVAAEVPVLALGAGAGLLAEAEIAADPDGTGPSARLGLTLTPPAGNDSLLADVGPPPEVPLPGRAPLPVAERDGRDPVALAGTVAPAGRTVLARQRQAFRLGSAAWGVPFVDGDRPGPWGELLLGRFAALAAARAAHTTTRAHFTRQAGDWEERSAHQAPPMPPPSRGCGWRRAAGRWTSAAAPAGRCRRCAQVGPSGQVVGVDVTPAMLASAARHARHRQGHLLAADCDRLPLPAGSVHGVFAAGLIDQLPGPRATLLEWRRVAAPGAVLLLLHPSGRAERAARNNRPLDPNDLLAEDNLRPTLERTGWRVDEYEDAPHHVLARAVLRR